MRGSGLRTQQNTSEISGDGNHAIRHLVGAQHVKNRFASRARWLAVIAHAFGQTTVGTAAHRSIGDMTRFRMLVANRLHKRERLIQGVDMTGVADEFRFFSTNASCAG